MFDTRVIPALLYLIPFIMKKNLRAFCSTNKLKHHDQQLVIRKSDLNYSLNTAQSDTSITQLAYTEFCLGPSIHVYAPALLRNGLVAICIYSS